MAGSKRKPTLLDQAGTIANDEENLTADVHHVKFKDERERWEPSAIVPSFDKQYLRISRHRLLLRI
jgi:hypothetical protein